MIDGETFVHDPSGTKTAVVLICAGRVWVSGGDGLLSLDHGAGVLRSATGDPDSETVHVNVHEGEHVIRAIDRGAGTTTELCRSALPLHIVGRTGVSLIVAEEHPGEPVGTTLLELHGPGDLRASPFTRLSSIDVFPDQNAVGSWGVVHPSRQRRYRGGGAGRLLGGGTADLRELAIPVVNAADVCAVGDRIYFLDDADGRCQVFSIGRDEFSLGDLIQETSFADAGATSLRRGCGGLVVGTVGEAWTLDTAASVLARVAAPGPDLVCAPTGHGAVVERALRSPDGDALAVIGEGVLNVLGAAPQPTVSGFVLDAAWASSDALLVLSMASEGVNMTEYGEHGAQVRPLPAGADEALLEGIEVAGTTVVLFGEEFGVCTRHAEGAWIDRFASPLARHVRPVVSRGGRRVAWIGSPDAASASLHVVDVVTEHEGELLVRGAALRALSFLDDDTLVFASQSLDPWTASVSPLREADVICEVHAADIIAHGSRASVRVRGRGLPGTRATVTIDGALWATAGSRTVAVEGSDRDSPFAGRFIGDARTPAFDSDTGIEIVDASGRLEVDIERAEPSAAASVAEALRLVRASSVDDAPDRAALMLRSIGVPCRSLADARGMIRACLRELGLSHAAIAEPGSPADSTPGLTEAASARLRTRAARSLESTAEFLALRDVGPLAVRAVENATRRWSGALPLVIDLRANTGGAFADHIATLLRALLDRALTYTSPRRTEQILGAPAFLNLIIDETTGSGGEQLAAILSTHPRVVIVGRRSVGAGTGFHKVRRIAGGVLTVPHYTITGSHRRGEIENRGVRPDVSRAYRHVVGDLADDELLAILPTAPARRAADAANTEPLFHTGK